MKPHYLDTRSSIFAAHFFFTCSPVRRCKSIFAGLESTWLPSAITQEFAINFYSKGTFATLTYFTYFDFVRH